MKPKYYARDFRTIVGRSNFDSRNPRIDYALLDKYKDDRAIKGINSYIGARTTLTSGPSKLMESLDLGDGRVLSPEEIEAHTVSKGEKMILDACHAFETVFGETTSPQKVLDILAGRKHIKNANMFRIYLLMFPLEASVIRLELRYPIIRVDRRIYESLVNDMGMNMEIMPWETNPTVKPDSMEPIGIEPGPRTPPITDEQLIHLLCLWEGADKVLAEKLVQLRASLSQSPSSDLN